MDEKVELLHIWISEHNRIFQNTDVNLSPEYQFSVTIDENREKKYHLSGKKTAMPNIMRNDTISNLSVVIGENGVGKTTLLKYLLCLNSSEPYIYTVHNSKTGIVAFTNISESELSYDNLINQCIYNEKHQRFDNFSKIYFTNGGFSTERIHFFNDGLCNLSITPNIHQDLAECFFHYLDHRTLDQEEKSPYVLYTKILKEHCEKECFNQYRDAIFYSKLSDNDSIFYRLLPKDYTVRTIRCTELLRQTGQHFKISEDLDSIFPKNISSLDLYKYNLKYNLIFEFYLYTGLETKLEGSFDDIYNSVKKKIEKEYRFSMALATFNPIRIRFASAIHEIDVFEKLNDEMLALLDKNKIILDKDTRFDLVKKKDLYFKFLAFLKEQFRCTGGSFVLNYLHIEYTDKSSGERGLSNLFSSLNILSFVNQRTLNDKYNLKKNVLLLIDEVDLYCHPEWQRDMIEYLHKAITEFFKNSNVQLVLTTHSPMVLSNIPKQNCVYLKRKGEQCCVDSLDNHIQTFGRNIYDLLNDAFYLKSTMGTFAVQWINELIDRVNRGQYDPNTIINEINLIGDPLIRMKLMEKIQSNESVERRAMYIKNQIAELENKLQLLRKKD